MEETKMEETKMEETKREPTKQAERALADFVYITDSLSHIHGVTLKDAVDVAADIVLALIEAGAYWNP